jgi:hypothetical protein
MRLDIDAMGERAAVVPDWKPGAKILGTWRKALAAYGPALEDIESAASSDDEALMQRSEQRPDVAGGLLSDLTDETESFLAAGTGFKCS